LSSYVNQLYFGITACASAIPDAAALRNDMLEDYTVMKRLILGDVRPLPVKTAEKEVIEHREVA